MAVHRLDLTPEASSDSTVSGRLFASLALIASLVLLAAAQLSFADVRHQPSGWWLVLATLVVALLWQHGLEITDWKQGESRQWGLARQWWRIGFGVLIAAAGAALWLDASTRLSENWDGNFDRGWSSWLAAAALMSAGLRILQAPVNQARDRMSRWEWLTLLAVFVVAAGFRLANFESFPPNDAVSQVEELQQGQWATQYFAGWRGRWEFLGQMWVAALGIWLGGPSLRAVRMTISVVALLKVIPAYFWFRALGGPAAAMVGTALLAVSGWDVIVNRIGGHQDALVITCCLALLAGPATRGLWAVYPWVALLAGYTIFSYIAYRPLILIALAGTAIAGAARLPPGLLSRARAVLPLALVVALIAGMFVPLTYRLSGPGRFSHEFLNGWHRARAMEDYYGGRDSWAAAFDKRWQRLAAAAGLFYTQGDGNPTHNVGARPQVDPVTGALLLLGIGYCGWRGLRGFYGLTLAGFGITFLGTLVATGNFDVLRAAANIPYVYSLVAVGAGAVYAACARCFGALGRVLAALALAFGVAWSGHWNATLLRDLWSSSTTREHYRNDLAYLSTWLRENAAGRKVIGLIPTGAKVVFQDHDASWLRGPNVRGESTWDVAETLARLRAETGEVVLLIASPTRLADIVAYFEHLFPGLQLQLRHYHATNAPHMAYGALRDPRAMMATPEFAERICRGIRARFEIRGRDGVVVQAVNEVIPYVDASTWPAEVREAAGRLQRDTNFVEASWRAEFTMAEGGPYTFYLEGYEGGVSARVNDTPLSPGDRQTVLLEPGLNHFEMRGGFRLRMVEAGARVSWYGGGELRETELVPFYKLAAPDPECLAKRLPGVGRDEVSER
jgi:hypothetical protein